MKDVEKYSMAFIKRLPCFQVTLENEENLDEIVRVLEEAYKLQN